MRASNRVIPPGDATTWLRRVQLAGVALVVICAALAFATGGASAQTLVSGSVTLTATNDLTPSQPVTDGTPYSSGQDIDITIAANSTLSLTNLEANGLTGEPTLHIEECSDPGGLASNLPTTPTNNCDGQTLISVNSLNADGSFTYDDYQVYALPDSNLGEKSTSVPACGVGNDECVLYLGVNQLNFSLPHLFSAPFSIVPSPQDDGANPGDGSPLAQTPTSATLSTVVATPAQVVADGENAAKVTVTLVGTNGAPVTTAKQVTLAQSGSGTILYNNSPGATGMTDPTTGTVVFSVTDTTAETLTFTATDDTDSDLALTPTAGNPSVQFVAPVVSATNSSVSASPPTVASGGSATVTVTLDDQGSPGEPVAGKQVTLAQGSGHSSITPSTAVTTNSSGQATFTVSDTTAESVTYTATDTTDNLTITGSPPATVIFGTLTVSATASTVAASAPLVSSGGNGSSAASASIVVTLLAADGRTPISGKQVTLAASSSNAAISPTASSGGAATNESGQATFTVSDTTAEQVTFTATDTTDSVVIAQTAIITFEPPEASATASSIEASVSSLPADGVTAVTLTVTMYNQFKQVLPGVTVAISSSSQTDRTVPVTTGSESPGVTDSTGTVTFYSYDTTAETVTYTAQDTTDNVTLSQTVSVTFVATAPEASNCTVTANPPTVAADGKTTSTITVQIEDHNTNPVPGQTISLAASGGSSVITATSPTTNSAGQATFTVADSTSEKVMYTATDTTDGLVLAGQAVVVTFGNPQPPAPTVADSTVVASPTQVPADGSTAATIMVVLADANGDALSGKEVALNPQSGSSSVSAVSATTNADGEATFTVTDKTAETVIYDATDVTDQLPLTGQSATVTFTATTGGSGSTTTTTTTTTTTPSTTATTTAAGTTATTSAPSTSSGGSSTENTGSGSSGGAGSGTGAAASSSGGTLALTGPSPVLRWLVLLGALLLVAGSVGRFRLNRLVRAKSRSGAA